jgi:hypothetical protein
MSERALVALAILACLTLAGSVLRSLSARRRRAVLASARLDPSPAARSRIIAFSGPGCAACATQRRIIDGLLGDWNGTVEVAYVDAVAASDLARRFGVAIVPTTVVAAADGRVIGVNGGLADAERLRAQLAAA